MITYLGHLSAVTQGRPGGMTYVDIGSSTLYRPLKRLENTGKSFLPLSFKEVNFFRKGTLGQSLPRFGQTIKHKINETK